MTNIYMKLTVKLSTNFAFSLVAVVTMGLQYDTHAANVHYVTARPIAM